MFFFPTIKREKFNQNRHQTNKVFFSFSSFTVIPATAPKLFFFFLQMTKSLSYGERIAIAARLAAIYARSLPAEKQPSFRTNMNNFITAGKFISENHGPFVDESSCQTVAQTIQKAVFREMYQCEIKNISRGIHVHVPRVHRQGKYFVLRRKTGDHKKACRNLCKQLAFQKRRMFSKYHQKLSRSWQEPVCKPPPACRSKHFPDACAGHPGSCFPGDACIGDRKILPGDRRKKHSMTNKIYILFDNLL